MSEEKCKHLVLDECSQEHHNNCLGMQQCILDLEQQFQAAKEENEKLKETTRIRLTNIMGSEGFNNVSFDIPKHFFSNAKIIEENTILTQENKRLREALENILKIKCSYDKENEEGTVEDIHNIAKQALGGQHATKANMAR